MTFFPSKMDNKTEEISDKESQPGTTMSHHMHVNDELSQKGTSDLSRIFIFLTSQD